MSGNYRILVINPGSTSTKIAVFENDTSLVTKEIRHSHEDLQRYDKIIDQFEFRRAIIMKALEEELCCGKSLNAVVARGGNMRPVTGGTYRVNHEMVEDLRAGVMGQHASNLGGILGMSVAEDLGVDAYVVDPVIVDEFGPLARISGSPLIARKSKDHPLNQKAVARKVAAQIGGRYDEFNFIVAHMGGGISVGAHKKGKIVDVNNSLDGDGPMSPERSGGLPFGALIDLCFSGKYTRESLRKQLIGGGGLAAYLGTSDALEVERRIKSGDERAKLIYDAMAYQIAKEIGACATVLKGDVDAVIFTGGLARSKNLVDIIEERVRFIAPVYRCPGEEEMQALAEGVLRVFRGEEQLHEYPRDVVEPPAF